MGELGVRGRHPALGAVGTRGFVPRVRIEGPRGQPTENRHPALEVPPSGRPEEEGDSGEHLESRRGRRCCCWQKPKQAGVQERWGQQRPVLPRAQASAARGRPITGVLFQR